MGKINPHRVRRVRGRFQTPHPRYPVPVPVSQYRSRSPPAPRRQAKLPLLPTPKPLVSLSTLKSQVSTLGIRTPGSAAGRALPHARTAVGLPLLPPVSTLHSPLQRLPICSPAICSPRRAAKSAWSGPSLASAHRRFAPFATGPPQRRCSPRLQIGRQLAATTHQVAATRLAAASVLPPDSPHQYSLQKIFLDTTRLLANHTDNVVDELWNYIKDGKLIHTAILLLAAQRQIRIGGSCKRNGNSNLNGFDIIKDRIVESMVSLETEGLGLVNGKNRKARNGLVLVIIFSQTGEALDAYIQTHSEVSHQEVLESVSSILQNYGFTPSGKGIDIGDLYCCPYDSGVSDKQLGKHGDTGTTKAAIESPSLNAEAKNFWAWMGHEGWCCGYCKAEIR